METEDRPTESLNQAALEEASSEARNWLVSAHRTVSYGSRLSYAVFTD
jgi:hypothetical protein